MDNEIDQVVWGDKPVIKKALEQIEQMNDIEIETDEE